jgi:capsular polysaccharide biosynthesis protein
MMGFDEAQILKLRLDTRYLCQRLHVFKIGQAHPPHPELMSYLRSKWYSTATQPRSGKRIFLERGAAGTRLIANAAEFDSLLDTEGFMRVDVAKLSLAEQQQLLADAEILMGSFGSNLFAVHFAPPGSVLINIMGEHRDDPLIQHMCYMIGVKHQLLRCKLALTGDATKAKDPDLVVDCVELSRRLMEISN